jgi:hypothetical protein
VFFFGFPYLLIIDSFYLQFIGKKKKKDKKGGKKGKKDKDLTGGRPMDELVAELVNANILQRPTSCQIKDFKGVPTYFTKEKLNTETPLHDLKRFMIEHCILPLGMDPQAMDDEIPLPKSIFLYGTQGVGKTTLVNMVATECGASLFNLSPKITAGQYVGKSNVARMVYTTFKVARARAPSIIVIDDAEAVFCKKVPKEDTSDPKRVRKDLVKAINGLKPSDRIIVIGCSKNPFYSDAKAISDAFNKVVYVPRPNYACRELMWREWTIERVFVVLNLVGDTGGDKNPLFERYPKDVYALITEESKDVFHQVLGVNFSVLARISSGMSGAMIQAVIERTLTPRRVHQLIMRPLKIAELVTHLLELPDADPQMELDFRNWTLRLPLFKKREIVLGLNQEEAVDPKGKDGKGGKDAKGKDGKKKK